MLDIRNPLAPILVSSGFLITINSGIVLVAGVPTTIPATTVSLTASATNYIFVSSGGNVTSNTTGFPITSLPIAQVVCSSAGITSVVDSRPDFIVGSGGGVASVAGKTGVVTLQCGDLTNSSASCSVDTTNAGNLVTGTLIDARLSTNVPLKNQANTFTGAITAPAFIVSGSPAADGWTSITDPTITTVGSLGTPTNGLNKIVTDGNSATDCTNGGGSNKNWCQGNGSAWIFVVAATDSVWLSSTVSPNAWSYYNGTAIKRFLTTESAVALSNLATQSADTLLANATGSSAVPTAVAFPTSGTNGCAGATDVLQYNTTTHTFGCAQISAGGGVGTIFFHGCYGNCSVGATSTYAFSLDGGSSRVDGDNTRVQAAIAAACTMKNLFVDVSHDHQPATGTLVATFVKNNVATALTCTVAAGGTSCSDTTHTVSLAQGDQISIQFLNNASTTSPLEGWSLQCQ